MTPSSRLHSFRPGIDPTPSDPNDPNFNIAFAATVLETYRIIGVIGEQNLKKAEELKQEGRQLKEESQKLKQEGQKLIDQANVSDKKNYAIMADSYHKILVKALGKTILKLYAPSQAELAKLPSDADRQKAMVIAADAANAFVEPYLNTHEKTTPQVTQFAKEANCMRLVSGTVEVIVDILKAKNFTAPDLTRFQTQLDSAALKALASNPQVTEVILAEANKGKQAEKDLLDIQEKKALKIFYLERTGPVEFKPTPSTSKYDSSPEGSPPKAIIAKPLPKPPTRALPKAPVLEAK